MFPTAKIKDWEYILDYLPSKPVTLGLVRSFLKGETTEEELRNHLKYVADEFVRYGVRFR